MTSRTPQRPDPDDLEELILTPQRSIPDGGLSSAMPEWLQQTPSWKRPPELPAARSIPAPDASVIDPRQLIDIDDLPEWLQAVSSRNVEPARVTQKVDDLSTPTRPETVTVATAPGLTSALEPVVPSALSPSVVDSPPTDRHEPVRLMPSPIATGHPWWMSDAVVAALFVAIILTIIYVILVASGAI